MALWVDKSLFRSLVGRDLIWYKDLLKYLGCQCLIPVNLTAHQRLLASNPRRDT